NTCPNTLICKRGITLTEWKNNKSPFVVNAKEELQITKNPTAVLKDKTERILQGELQFFNAEWLNVGIYFDWLTNPSNNYKYDAGKHWSEIPDLSNEAGDI